MLGEVVRVHDRGFGFIRPLNSPEQFFFHVKALVEPQQRANFGDGIVGTWFVFELMEGRDNRQQAVNLRQRGIAE